MNPQEFPGVASGALSPADRARLEYDALTRQLERMRAMQYAYNRKFFSLLLVSTLVALGLLLWDNRFAGLVVAFGLVSTGVTASFFLHFCDFARVHARALEARINALLGARVLIASELEAEYFYPHARPKFSGFSFDRPLSFFSVYTLHFSAVWGALILWSAIKTGRYFSGDHCLGWGFLWLTWTCIHAVYLRWWFMASGAERRMAERLGESYGLAGDPGGVGDRAPPKA